MERGRRQESKRQEICKAERENGGCKDWGVDSRDTGQPNVGEGGWGGRGTVDDSDER